MYLCLFMRFYALKVVINLSDWKPNGEYFGIHKSFVDPKDLPNMGPSPAYSPTKNCLRASISPGLIFLILRYLKCLFPFTSLYNLHSVFYKKNFVVTRA